MTDITVPLRDSGGTARNMRARSSGAGEMFYHAMDTKLFIASAVPAAASFATPYSSGDVIGGLMTFAGVSREDDRMALLSQVIVHSKTTQQLALDLILFHTTPTSAFTDNSALALDAADFDKILDVVHIYDWTSLAAAGPSMAKASALGVPFNPISGTDDIKGVLVARAAMTLASAADLKVITKTVCD